MPIETVMVVAIKALAGHKSVTDYDVNGKEILAYSSDCTSIISRTRQKYSCTIYIVQPPSIESC
jgi:hypothetical protein